VTLPSEAAGAVADPVTLGVLVGLVVGKAVGITGSCWLSVRLRLAALPSGATWWQLYGIASLCGIGFTMSLFIATLALADPAALDRAKIGILLASFLAGIHG
jgi:NhaA family Na+:H+ antiporter